MFVFLSILTFEVVRLQLRENELKLERLETALAQKEMLTRFVPADWAKRLAKGSLDLIRPGDAQSAESILVQVRSPDDPGVWLPLIGTVATNRRAMLVDWRDGMGIWALDTWSETALAFALEAQQRFVTVPGMRFCILLTRAVVRYQVLNLDLHWLPVASDLPFKRFEELHLKAERCGALVILDSALQDGLAIGGWRRHRSLSVAGTEIELYESEDETLAELKDKTLESFESAMGLAQEGNWTDAIQALFTVVQENPFDQAARALLSRWGSAKRS